MVKKYFFLITNSQKVRFLEKRAKSQKVQKVRFFRKRAKSQKVQKVRFFRKRAKSPESTFF
jgi:hypothetical protein